MTRIRWSPPLPLQKLVRLYRSDADGMLDEDLLNDVAFGLLARCISVLRASKSHVLCPACGVEFEVPWIGRPPDEISSCPGCGWTVTAGEFHKSIEHKDLLGGNARGAFERYVEGFGSARAAREKMMLIDRLIHEAHRPPKGLEIGNTVARNLFEGRTSRIVATLDSLAYGDGSAADVERHAAWRARYGRSARPRGPAPCD